MAAVKSPQKDDSDDRVEEYEPQVDFQPVVPMPDLVETKTGKSSIKLSWMYFIGRLGYT